MIYVSVSEGVTRLVELGVRALDDHVRLLPPAQPSKAATRKIWDSTCRVVTREGSGSGFSLLAEQSGQVVATNAHVMGRNSRARLEWSVTASLPMGAGQFEFPAVIAVPAKLEAIDWPTDLALLVVEREAELEAELMPASCVPVADEWQPSPGLELASAPSPGDDILMCGFPFAVESPRLVRGLVSGYASDKTFEGWSITSVVIDATVHLGNSGGPICNLDGAVVGVIRAVVNPLPLDDSGLTKGGREIARRIVQSLRAATGIGFAIDPSRVKELLDARVEWRRKDITTAEKVPPVTVQMTRSEFIDLQLLYLRGTARPENASVIGAFSLDDTGRVCLGWSTDQDRVAIEPTEAWRRVVRHLNGGRGSFFLRGYDVLQYQKGKRAAHFIVPVAIQLNGE